MRIRSRQDSAAPPDDDGGSSSPAAPEDASAGIGSDEDTLGVLDSLNPAGFSLGEKAKNVAASLEDPGKLVRQAVKPFKEEMDRIETEYRERMEDDDNKIDQKMQEMMKKLKR